MSSHKTSLLLLAVICISGVIVGVNALNSNEWSYSFYWNSSSNIYYQGDNASVTFTFYSNSSEPLRISYLGVALDWAPNTYYADDLSSNPADIASYGLYQFNAISINIPSDASFGVHELTFLFKGQEQGQTGWSTFSVTGTGTITVLTADEGEYNQKAQSLSTSLTIASDSIINNPVAVGLLGQAYDAYNEAAHLANLGQWQAAINDLNTASNYLSQAQVAEENYAHAPSPTPAIPELSRFVILPLLLSAFAVAVIVRHRKNR